MNKLIFTFILLLLPVLSVAQKKQKYSDEQIKAAYEGTWKYENKENDELFIITLVHKKGLYPEYGYTINVFLGFLYYSKNGVVYYDNLKDTSRIAQFETYNDIDFNTHLNYIHLDGHVAKRGIGVFNFKDILLENKYFYYFFVRADRVDKDNRYLYWDVNDRDPKSYDIVPKNEPTEPDYPDGCTVPMKVTLERVK